MTVYHTARSEEHEGDRQEGGAFHFHAARVQRCNT
jgi:hypothetical protein